MKPFTTIVLDEYQVSNLKAALEAIGYPADRGHARCPLNVLNTGDWLGELYNKLPETTYYPNTHPADMVRASLESSFMNLFGILMNDIKALQKRGKEQDIILKMLELRK